MRARERRANPFIYGFVRVTFQAFFVTYFRMKRIGAEHVPRKGSVIIASNHRSFLDPFVIACMARRPMYYVAKKEIFGYSRVLSWLLASLGAFPVDRGAGDAEFIKTATAILERGDIVLIFPEGTRTRPGPLGRPRRGVGRLALETGVPVVPVAVIGTEAIRRGWRIRPHRVKIRAGRGLVFDHVADPSPELAGEVTDRIWPRVMLQWEWLGGAPPARRAAVIGSGPSASALAACLARGGLDVKLAWAVPEHARTPASGRGNAGARTPASGRGNAGVPAETASPAGVEVVAESDLRLEDQDIVCLAVPARELPAVMDVHGARIGPRCGLLVLADGAGEASGTLPSAFAAERSTARAVAVLGPPMASVNAAAEPGDRVVVASRDRAFARELGVALGSGGLDVRLSGDIAGVELGARVSAGGRPSVKAAPARIR